MKFISLIDTSSQYIYTVDANALVLRVEINKRSQEIRLKPYHAEILFALFNKHPIPLFYDEIIDLLKHHNLIIADVTRMHRKLSELRQFLEAFHSGCADMILNTRGIGYSLPLRFKNLHQFEHKDTLQFKNPHLTKSIDQISYLINEAIDLTSKAKIIKHLHGYVLDREPFKQVLVDMLSRFNECEQSILKELRSHEADFISIRVSYSLAKLKTYIGLVRISEFPISEIQWLDWFQQEVWMLFEDLKKLIKSAEAD